MLFTVVLWMLFTVVLWVLLVVLFTTFGLLGADTSSVPQSRLCLSIDALDLYPLPHVGHGNWASSVRPIGFVASNSANRPSRVNLLASAFSATHGFLRVR